VNGFTPAEFGTKLDSVKNRELGASELLQLLDDSIPSIQEKTAGAPVRLALDGVSGTSTALLCNILSRDGTLVSHSAMSGVPMSISPLDVIFKSITVRGFLLNDYDFASFRHQHASRRHLEQGRGPHPHFRSRREELDARSRFPERA